MDICTEGHFFPRREKKRRFDESNLRKLIVARRAARLRCENVGIIGAENTGRNTLVRRFLHMSEGPFVTPQDRKYSRRNVFVELLERPTFGIDQTVKLDFYILNARERNYDSFGRYIPNLRSIAFIFDVSFERTLNVATSCINRIRQEYVSAPSRFIILGNKIDLDVSSNAMRYIRRQAHGSGAERFYQCSALENINMDSVLDAILCLTFYPDKPLPE